MAADVVGTAYVVIRAVTNNVDRDIKNAFSGVDDIGQKIGANLSDSIQRGLTKGFGGGGFDIGGMFTSMDAIEAASEKFTHLTRTGYAVQAVMSAVSSVIGVLITSIITLGSVAIAGAIPAILNLAGALGALVIAGITAKLAFSGVAQAIQAGIKATRRSAADTRALAAAERALTRATEDYAKLLDDSLAQEILGKRAVADATYSYAKAVRTAQQALRDLAFDTEDGAIKEKKAALELEKARETLARVSDLPPNSRARKEAELAFAEADLNYRKTIDSNKQLKAQNAMNAKMGPDFKSQVEGQRDVELAKRAVEDATKDQTKSEIERQHAITRAAEDLKTQGDEVDRLKKGGTNADAFANAMSKLSPEAQKFVKYIISLEPAIKSLKEAAGKELFPKITTAIKNLTTLLPVLKPLLQETGGVLGDIAIKISKVFTEPKNVERIKNIWSSSNVALGFFGGALSNVLSIILILWDNLGPYIEKFAKWTDAITGSWKATLLADEKSGKLKDTLDKLYGVAGKLGTIFGNLFGGLGKLIMANIGPGSGGDKFLNYFIDITDKFKNLKSIDGKPVKKFFSDAADNGIKLFDIIGKVVFAFMRLADNKGFGKFLDSVGKAVDIFSQIGEDMDSALPSVGKFVEEFARFVKTVVDGDSLGKFFDTLKTGLQKVNDFLNSNLGQKLVDLSNRFLPILASLGIIGQIGAFAFNVVIGGILKLLTPIMSLVGWLGKTVSLFELAGPYAATVTAPMWLLAAAVGAVVAVFVGMYANSEKLRKAVSDLISTGINALKDAFTTIKNVIGDAFPTKDIEGIKNTLKVMGDFVATYIVPIFKVTLKGAIDIAAGAIKGLVYAISAIKSAFVVAFDVVKAFFQFLTGHPGDAAKSLKAAFGGVLDFLKNGFKGLASLLTPVLNLVIKGYNNTLGKFKIKMPSWMGGREFGFPTIPEIKGFGSTSTKDSVPAGLLGLSDFANGGTVFPSAGGTIARVAEAGRAERIEPLDPQGLSKRDHAIIDKLSGGGKNIQIIVNPSPGMDERELAALVSRQISYAMRGGGS